MKIRPKRILKGFWLKFFSRKKDFAIERYKTCLGCEYLKQGRFCGICGCEADAKSDVEEEYCPINKWKDVMVLEKTGVAVKNQSTDKVDLYVKQDSNQFVVDFGKIERKNHKIKLMFVNDRGSFENFKQETLTGISFKTSCGCTSLTTPPKELDDGDSFEVDLEYKPNSTGSIKKKAFFESNEAKFKIQLKGQVV